MCKLSMRNLWLRVSVGSRAVIGLVILMSVKEGAWAQNPSGCNGDTTFATLGRAAGQSQFITNGATVSVSGTIANQTLASDGTVGCNASNIVAFFVCPAANGGLVGGNTNALNS